MNSTTKEKARAKIAKLVENFTVHADEYKKGKYNETQVRREYIDPFFKALGWDIDNEEGFAEQYKDVVHEDSVKVGVSLKAPDYSFRIGGQRKFFLEAKKPSVNIKEDKDPAFQLRRYGWSAKLSLSIVTDFEEFAVYDCRIKPSEKDKVGLGRIQYLTYKDYDKEFDYLYDTFSKDAVLRGSFDTYIESSKKHKGTSLVDAEFLKVIESFRLNLAKHIASKNTSMHLSVDDLNFAVQQTIDRIIFLRICEDKGIENYGQLQGLLNGKNIYNRLFEVFYQADKKYNSGLFDFNRDTFTHKLTIDDKVLKEIISELYPPKSPYEFSVLATDTLGNIYEQFLGKVITLSSTGKTANVEEKPEVKKAGGVYYTPDYIVNYIVENTVGELLKGKTPTQALKLKVLDPACGSGSFLIGAYDYLLKWYTDWYSNNSPEKHTKGKNPKIFKIGVKSYRLTTQEKKNILKSNIYGVDIDRQAVEVTKLSLLLKVLEDENAETLGKNLTLFRERVLPNLSSNIKCGNSLIGPDFYSQQELGLGLDNEEQRRINAFDWEDKESGFGDIMKDGGFDAVIGNPPWGASFTNEEKNYLVNKFSFVHMRTPDSFNYFIGKTTSLTNNSGIFSFIIPNNFLFQHEYSKSRKFLLDTQYIKTALNLGDGVFEVTAPSCIIVITKSKNTKTHVSDLRATKRADLRTAIKNISTSVVEKNTIVNSPDYVIPMNPSNMKLFNKILSLCKQTLGDLSEEVASGISTGGDKIFRQHIESLKLLNIEEDLAYPVLTGREILNYYTPSTIDYKVIYSTRDINNKTHPNTIKYLKEHKTKLSSRSEAKKGLMPWWAMNRPRYNKLFEDSKIIVRQTSDTIIATIDNSKYYCLDSILIIKLINTEMYPYILGLLNSRLLRNIYTIITQESSRIFAQVKPINLRKLPIRTIDFDNKDDKEMHDKMVALVERMLDLNKRLNEEAKTPHDKEMLERQIKQTDKEIDTLVYKLYDLTPEEIKIVEEG